MKAEIELNGNLELYLTDEIPIEYYQAIQRSSFVKITGEWDQFALNGIENMQAKYNVERTDNGVVDLATIEALIMNATDKKEYYDEHPTIEKIEKVVGDFFSGGVGDMVEYFGLSFIGAKVIDEVKPNNKKPEVKSGEGTGNLNVTEPTLPPGGNGYGINPTSNPDFLINGKAFDCYSPETLKVRNIWATVVKKTEEQASRIVMNLDGYKGSMDELYEQFNKYEIPTLDELIIIKDGQITRLKP